MSDVTVESLKETLIALKRELPAWLRSDPELRALLLDVTRAEFSTRLETEDWFSRALAELRRDREEQARKWDEQTRKWGEETRKWEAQERKWDEQQRKWEANQAALDRLYEQGNRDREEQTRKWDEEARRWQEQARQWDEQQRKWEAHQAALDRLYEQGNRDREELARKWDEQQQKWEANQAALDRLYEQGNRDREEQARKWEANQAELLRIHEEIMAQARKFDRSIGALGARWGTQSEKAFRDALAGILEEHFGVEVVNVTDFDAEGEVFGRPEQVELDVIIKDGLLLICELKSSIDKAGMYSFERKARFYEKRHGRQATRLIVISPMIDPRAQKVAERLGIETFGDSVDVRSL